MKRFLSLLICAIFGVLQVSAYHFSAESPSGHMLFYNVISEEEKTVALCYEKDGNEPYEDAPEGELIIPGTVTYNDEPYSVIKINSSSFWNCNKITSVVIQEGVQTIGSQVFQGCSKIQSVVLPNSLTEMSGNNFSGCKKLKNVTFSSNLTQIPNGTFWECISLQSVELPNSIKTIEPYAFYLCESLESVHLPEGITKIKEEAFGHCPRLSSINLPESLVSIGRNAFYSDFFATIVIPANVTDIADYAFGFCSNLTQIYFSSNSSPSLGDNALPQVENLNIYVPCDAIDNYKSNEDWLPYKSYLKTASHKIFVNSSNFDYGYVTVEMTNSCENEYTAILTAVTKNTNEYQFGGWNDGNKDNPRTITVTKDTSFTALFGEKPQIINVETVNPICTSATGSVSFDVINGVSPYTVTWYGEDNTDNPRTGMTEGDYAFFVTDALGFTSDLQYEYLYSENNNMPVIETNTVLPICETATGEITPTITGGQEPYSYQWSEFSTKETKILTFEENELPISIHARIYDENYTSGLSYQIHEGGALGTKHAIHMDDEMYDDIFILQTDINNTFNITGELGISFYHKGEAMKFGLAIDKYLFHMKDIPAHPIWTKVEFNLDELNPTQEELLTYLQNECGYDYNLFAEKALKLGYVWQFNQQEVWIDEISFTQNDESSAVSTDEKLTNIASGLYELKVTDTYGCATTSRMYVGKNVSNSPEITFETKNPICETENGEISVTVTGGTEPYTYQWNDGETAASRTNLAENGYMLTVTDANGCTQSESAVLEKDYSNIPQIEMITKNPICETENGEITTTVTNGVEPFAFAWNTILPTLISNFEEEENMLHFAFFNDSYLGGTTNVDESGITTGGALGTARSMRVKATSISKTIVGDYALLYGNLDGSYGGIAHLIYGISFYHKGAPIDFRASGEDYNNYYTQIIPSHDDWTLVTVFLGEGFSPNDFYWAYRGEENYKNEIEFQIDEIKFLMRHSSDVTTKDQNNLSEGIYKLTVTDTYGCANLEYAELKKDYSNLPQTTIEITNPICETANGEILANVTGGTEPYSYNWTHPNVTKTSLVDFEDDITEIPFYLISTTDIYDAFNYKVTPLLSVNGGANNTDNATHIQVSMSSIDYFEVQYDLTNIDLSNTYGVSFYHKGSSIPFVTRANIETLGYTIPYHEEWTYVQFSWEDFSITPENRTNIISLAWYALSQLESESYDFWLDEISILTFDSEQNLSTNHTIDGLSEGLYNLTLTDANGCINSQNVTLTKDESNKPVIKKSFANAICGHDVGEISVSYEKGNGELQYAWNDGSTDLQRTGLAPGTYTFTISDEYGCTASDVTEIKAESFQYQPEIALVTVSQESPANLVVWQKEETEAIDFYTIYRETSSKNVYEKIEDVPFNQTSIYVDEKTDSQTKAYRYKISATDYCGNESPQSPNHKTINATASLGVGGVVNLIWDGYEGFDFSTYSIYRITTTGATEIDKVPSTNWTYVDKNVPKNTLSYFVAVELPDTIDVNKPFVKAESGPFSLAISNIAEIENQGTAIASVNENLVNVYPAHKAIVVENAGENQITICNAVGQTIVRAKGENDIQKTFAVESGIYIVIVSNKAVKVVVE